MSEPSACLKYACAIQACLEKNGFQELKCTKQLEDLKKCCNDLLAKGGSSPCCPEKKENNK